MNSPTTPPEGAQITTTLAGRVTDESGASVAGARITAQNGSATTDANGLFFISNASVPSDRTFILAKKAGYFDGARAAIPTSNGVTYMQIMLASDAPIGSINAATGGTVNLAAGGSITLPPGGVVTSSGASYTGSVSVSAEHLDPGNGNFANLFAGDLTGQQTDGSQTELQSYGVIIAELHGSSGETLQPASGSPATLTMPIAAAEQATAPASIPLWYFDENLGMWKEEGTATKQGNSYVGTVAHFSFWNYDMQCPYGTITGTIVCNDVPIPGVVVNLGALVEGGQPYVVTDGSGRFTVRVVANSKLVILQVLANENNGIYWTNTPIVENVPANVTTDVGQIALSSPCPSYMTGTLKGCNNTPIPGMVLASWNGGMSYIFTTNGQFRLTAPSGDVVTLAATAASGDVAQPQTVTAGAQGAYIPVPDIVACNSQNDIKIDISGTFNGTAMTFSPDDSKLAVAASNGRDVILLDVATGTTTATLTSAFTNIIRMPPQNYGQTGKVEFSADGGTILTFETYGGFNIWKSDGSRVTPSTIQANSACLMRDGLSVIGSDNTHGTFQYTIASATYSASFAIPDSYTEVIGIAGNGSQFVVTASSKAYRWDIGANAKVSSFALPVSHDSSSSGTHVSFDGNILGIESNTMSFFNTQTGSTISTSNINPSYGISFGIDPDDAHFIGQYQSGMGNTVGLFNMTDGTPSHLFDAPASFGNSSGVAISHDGKLAAAAYPSEIRIWNVQ